MGADKQQVPQAESPWQSGVCWARISARPRDTALPVEDPRKAALEVRAQGRTGQGCSAGSEVWPSTGLPLA